MAHHLVRLLGERGLVLWGGTGLGLSFALLALAPNAITAFAAIVLCGITFYMLHNTLQTNGTQMAPEARGSALALFALCLFVGQAIGVPVAAPIVDRYGAEPIFLFAAVFLPLLSWYFAWALKRHRFAGG
jgi:YNFM family putative membrane transporter